MGLGNYAMRNTVHIGHGVGRGRRGLSVLEFLGCVIAVVGGIWLGAIYLGVDVRHIAHTALNEAELLEHMPADWRPPAPQESVTREQLVETLREELSNLKSEITNLRTEVDAEPVQTDQNAATTTEEQQAQPTKERSLAYWARLNEIALGEAALQGDAESAFDATKAAKVFAVKGRIVRFAAKAVEAIPAEQVDPSLLQFGRQLSTWYEHGGVLYDRAVQIWESATNSQGREQLNADWERAELHHGNEARLIREKASAVRSAVSRRFGEEFPAFADAAQ
jgi:hypothetical protein